MTNPEITVLMPVYNGERFLKEAIESILNQTFENFEILIINDGSTDTSKEIITSYSDQRIRLVENTRNIGLAASLNNGLRMARGRLMARQDADDISLPHRFQCQTAYMKTHPDTVLLGTQGIDIDEKGICIGSLLKPESMGGIRWYLLFDNPFIHTSVMFHKDTVLNKLGGYDEDFPCAQDYDLWSRTACSYTAANLGEYLVQKRTTSGSITSQMARDEGVELCGVVHARNVESVFGAGMVSKDKINLISGFRLGLSPKQITHFYMLFKTLLKNYLKYYSGAIENRDFKATIALQYLKIADQGLFNNNRIAVSAFLSSIACNPGILVKCLNILKARLLGKRRQLRTFER